MSFLCWKFPSGLPSLLHQIQLRRPLSISPLTSPPTLPAQHTHTHTHTLSLSLSLTLCCSHTELKSLSHVQLFTTLWTVAYQAPPSMGFSRQEYCSGLPFPSPSHTKLLDKSIHAPAPPAGCPCRFPYVGHLPLVPLLSYFCENFKLRHHSCIDTCSSLFYSSLQTGLILSPEPLWHPVLTQARWISLVSVLFCHLRWRVSFWIAWT